MIAVKDDYEDRKALDPNIAEEVFVNYLAPKKSDITVYKLKLPVKCPTIQFCYS